MVRAVFVASLLVCWGGSAHAALIAADAYPIGTNRAAGEWEANTSIQSTVNNGLVTPGFVNGPYASGIGTSNFLARATGYDHVPTGATSATGRVEWLGSTEANTNRSVARNLATPTPVPVSSTYYVSHLMSRGDIATAGSADAYVLTGFGNTTFPSLGATSGNLLGFYVGFAQDGVAGNFGNLVIRTRNAGTATAADTVLVNGAVTNTSATVYHVVLKVDVNVGGGSADTITWWLNPDDGSSDATLTATADATGSFSSFAISVNTDLARLNYAMRNWSGNAFFDEPRLSTDLAGLGLAVPEPTGIGAIIAIAGFAALARRRRRTIP